MTSVTKLSKVIKVGDVKKHVPNKTGPGQRSVPYAYADIEYDYDGWADSSKYLPDDFDLVYLKIKGKKIMSGWRSGNYWVGLKYKEGDHVLFWKRQFEGDSNL